MATSKKTIRLTCAGCGNTFPAVRADTETCSSSCRNKVWQQRRREHLAVVEELLKQFAQDYATAEPETLAAMAREAQDAIGAAWFRT
jgi:hypothetical protein